MVTAFIQSETISFDQNIFTVLNDLKKTRKHADIDSTHKEIIKTIDFKKYYQGWPWRQDKYTFDKWKTHK